MSRYRGRIEASDVVLVVLLFIAFLGIAFAVSLLAAQFVCFGLSYFHVQSGIIGPYWILAGINLAVGTSILSSRRGK